MRLAICHKQHAAIVMLYYSTAAKARAARAKAFEDAAVKKAHRIHFGPDESKPEANDCEIHVDCLGSVSILDDLPTMARPQPMPQPAPKPPEKSPLITLPPGSSLAPVPGDGGH